MEKSGENQLQSKLQQQAALGFLKQRELFFLCVAASLGIQTLLAPLEKVLGASSWLAVLISIGLGFCLPFLYGTWGRLFGNRSWGAIFIGTYGKGLGKILLVAYALVFLLISLNTLWFLTYFWSSLGLVKTPQFVYVLSLLVVITVFAKGGRRVLGRLANLLVFGAVILILLNLLFMLKDIKLVNFSGFGQFDPKVLVWTGVSSFLILFGELFVVLPFLPVVAEPEKTNKTIGWAVALAGIIMFLTVVRNLGVLGGTAKLFTFPTMQALRLVEFGNAFSKIEVFGALVLLTVGIIRLAVVVLAAISSIESLFRDCKEDVQTTETSLFRVCKEDVQTTEKLGLGEEKSCRKISKSALILAGVSLILLIFGANFYADVESLMYLLFTWYPVVVLAFGVVVPVITICLGSYKKTL